VHALKRFPIVNASIDGTTSSITATSTSASRWQPARLVVPIIRDADQLSIAELEAKIADFGKRAQEGKLAVDELAGGTYTISNGGVFGSMLSTPIINPPQSRSSGCTRRRSGPWSRRAGGRAADELLAQSYDHASSTPRGGALARGIKEALEDPARMLLEL